MTNDPRQISRIDRHLLEELQANGRLSNAELAVRIRTSESSCLRHRQRLEKAGIIKGYAAVLDRDALGYSESAFVRITLRTQRKTDLDAFETAVVAVEEVMACHAVDG